MTIECHWEEDVLDALTARQWPDRCPPDLRAHVKSCAICTDLVEVASAVQVDHDVAWREARVPPSSVVWWRAQLRAREDAARSAARPLGFIQGVAATIAVWLVVTLLRAVPSSTFAAWRAAARQLPPFVTFTLSDVVSVFHLAGIAPIVILCLLATWLLVAPLAIYFAVGDE
jgi:hypothetical protein